MASEGKSSKGVVMYLTKGDAAKATVVPTAISKAKPAEITAPDPGAPLSAYSLQQIVYFRDTGFPELDSRYFTIASVTAGTGFTAKGSDTTTSTGVLMAATAKIDVYDNTDLLKLCLNNFAFNLETAGTVPVGTYCNPSATIPASATGVGTATLGGWIDKDDPAYAELLLAQDDGLLRIMSIVLPLSQGEIIAPLYINNVTWDIPLEGGMAFTASATLASKPRHVF